MGDKISYPDTLTVGSRLERSCADRPPHGPGRALISGSGSYLRKSDAGRIKAILFCRIPRGRSLLIATPVQVNCALSALFPFRIEVFRHDEDFHPCHRTLFLGGVVNSDSVKRVASLLGERNVIDLMPQVFANHLRR